MPSQKGLIRYVVAATEDGYAEDAEDQAPRKKQKLEDNAAEPAAAATAAAPIAAVPSEQRYAAELAQLHASFPEYDEELIISMLEDQGGDMLEVHAALKVRYWASMLLQVALTAQPQVHLQLFGLLCVVHIGVSASRWPY